MAFKKRWLFVILAAILALSLLPACAADKSTPAEPSMATPTPGPILKPPTEPGDEISLEEAEELMGVPLLPKYLPAGYELQGCVLFRSGTHANVVLGFSDEEITEEAETTQDSGSSKDKITFSVHKVTKMPPPDTHEKAVEHRGGKVVDINGIKGWLSSGGHELHWFLPGLHFYMYVAVDLPEEEILKIARSIK